MESIVGFVKIHDTAINNTYNYNNPTEHHYLTSKLPSHVLLEIPKLPIHLPLLPRTRARPLRHRPLVPIRLEVIRIQNIPPCSTSSSLLSRSSALTTTRSGHGIRSPAHLRIRPVQCARDLLVLDQHNHPDAHAVVAAEERRAVDPTRFAALVAGGTAVVAGVCKPLDFGGDAGAVREGVFHAFFNLFGAGDAVEELGLEEARDAQGRGGEGYAKGRVGPNEHVLFFIVS